MLAVNERVLPIQHAELSSGVTPLSDSDLRTTEGGMMWWAALGVGAGAGLIGVGVGVAVYYLVK